MMPGPYVSPVSPDIVVATDDRSEVHRPTLTYQTRRSRSGFERRI